MSAIWIKQELAAAQCVYCRGSLSPTAWEDEFSDDRRYLVTTCSCGKGNRVRFTIDGVGRCKDWRGRQQFGWPPYRFNRFLTKFERKVVEEHVSISQKHS